MPARCFQRAGVPGSAIAPELPLEPELGGVPCGTDGGLTGGADGGSNGGTLGGATCGTVGTVGGATIGGCTGGTLGGTTTGGGSPGAGTDGGSVDDGGSAVGTAGSAPLEGTSAPAGRAAQVSHAQASMHSDTAVHERWRFMTKPPLGSRQTTASLDIFRLGYADPQASRWRWPSGNDVERASHKVTKEQRIPSCLDAADGANAPPRSSPAGSGPLPKG